jgi:hypothetical protein
MAMILCAISFAAASAASEQPCNKEQSQQGGNAQPPQEKPPTDSVLVEAYLVEVSNAALAASGTAMLPGDGKKESVSITKLLWCMKDPNAGKVVSMGRILCFAKRYAKSSTRTEVPVKTTEIQVASAGTPIQSVSYNRYASMNEIEVRPDIIKDGSVFLELKFKYDGFTENKTDGIRQVPPETLGCNFDSTVVVNPNQPMIVGGMQSGDASLFLIVRAEIVK